MGWLASWTLASGAIACSSRGRACNLSKNNCLLNLDQRGSGPSYDVLSASARLDYWIRRY